MSQMTKDELYTTLSRVLMRDKPKKKPLPWNPYKATCKDCGWIFWSKWPGHYAECVCGKSAVDQTREYARMCGQVETLIGGEVCVWYWPARNKFLIASPQGFRYKQKNKRMYMTGQQVPSTALIWSQL